MARLPSDSMAVSREERLRVSTELEQAETTEFSEQLKTFRERDSVIQKNLGLPIAGTGRAAERQQVRPTARVGGAGDGSRPGSSSSQGRALDGQTPNAAAGAPREANEAREPQYPQAGAVPGGIPAENRPFLRPDRKPGFQPPVSGQNKTSKASPVDPARLQRFQNRADNTVRAGNRLVDRAAQMPGAKTAESKAVGMATSKVWYWGAGAAYLSGFTIVGFYLGTLVMNVYWVALHRRNKVLFPMKVWQKVVTIFSNLLALLVPIVVVVLLLFVACQIPGSAYTELGGVCKSLNETAMFNVSGGNQSGNITLPSGPLSTDSWTGAIQSILASGRYPNVDACMMRVIIQKESGGNSAVIGYDYPPDKRSNPFQPNNPPLYGLNWAHSHGIGLTQWTIFPQNSSNRWQDPNTPSRYLNDPVLGARYYTLADFLNPQISLQLTAATLNRNIQANMRNGMDRTRAIKKAFGDYNGSGENGSYANSTIQLYTMCLQQFGGR